MQQRLASLYDKPILFAHRGASAHAAENTRESFQLALKLGATGLETDCWVTKDSEVVLDHDGVVKGGIFSILRSTKISEVASTELPGSIPRYGQLLKLCPEYVSSSIDVCDTRAMPLIAASTSHKDNPGRIFICHPDIRVLESWKVLYPAFRYVNSIRLGKIVEGPERRCADLAKFKIDALNMHHTDWNGGLVSLAHRFNIAAFSWDLQHDEQLRTALLMGVDAVYSDWPDRMTDAINKTLPS